MCSRNRALFLLLLFLTNLASARVIPRPESLIPLAREDEETTWPSWRAEPPLDFYPNIRVNTDNSGLVQNEEMACINPLDQTNFVAVWRDFRLGYRRVGVGYSTNSGQSWTDALFPQMFYDWQSDPILVVDTAGVFTAMVISLDPANGPDGLLQLTSSDSGQTWHDSVWAINAVQPPGFEDKEMLTVDPTRSPYAGSFYCVWTHFYGVGPVYDSTHIWLNYKRPNLAYSQPLILSQTASNQWPNVCVGPNGEVYVTWGSYLEGGVMFTHSLDGGQTFAPQHQITSTNFVSANIVPDMLVFAYSALAVDLSNGPHRGRLYTVFTDGTGAGSETDVWLMYSDDGGQNWSPRIRMDDEHAAYPVDQFHPWISVDEDGRVWVAFYDRRNDPAGIRMDVYFTVSTDGGATWRDNERVTPVSSNPGAGQLDGGLIGEYFGWQARHGKALAVWTDTRLGNQDVFSAYLDTVFVDSTDEVAPLALQPASFGLSAYPNPFNPTTTLSFSLKESGRVKLDVFDLAGRLISAPELSADKIYAAGENRIEFDGRALPSGIYFARLQAGRFKATQKLLLLK